MSIVKYKGNIPTDLFSLFDDLHDAFWKEPSFQLNRNWRPTDISEDEKKYQIEIELPRFKKEDVKVEVSKGVLKIVAKNNKATYTREFSLSFADYDKTEVKLEDGVLKITIPKSGEGTTKYLEVK